jgi:hypothetical protein
MSYLGEHILKPAPVGAEQHSAHGLAGPRCTAHDALVSKDHADRGEPGPGLHLVDPIVGLGSTHDLTFLFC